MTRIKITLPGPSHAAINQARRCGCRGRTPYSMPTPNHKQWRQAAVEAVKRAVAETGWQTVTGPVAAEIVAIWPRKIASGEMAGFAFGDIDAPVKAVLDAVAAGGVISDDKQVVKARLTKQHGDPCVTVIIERLT